jgi:hypothetical protein
MGTSAHLALPHRTVPSRSETRSKGMTRLGLLLAAVVAPGGCRCDADAAQPGSRPEDFYSLRALPTFEIQLEPDAREALASAPREWVKARFRYRDETWEQVAVRLKGHRSMRKLDEKPSFKVQFDKYVKQRFLGLRSITLNGMVEDPTQVREALGYRLYREVGVPAPDTGYAQVTLDGQPLGLYLLVESVDQEFLDRRFGDHKGDMYEGEYGCDLNPEDVAGMEREVGGADRRPLAALVDDATAEDALRLIGGAGSSFDRTALDYLAVSALIGDFDGYRHSHNYRIYRDPEVKRWFFIPWGIDRAFYKRLDPFDSNGVVARRCFADHDCRIAYLRELRRVLGVADKLNLEVGVDVLGAFVADASRDDPRRPYPPERTAKARSRLKKFLAERAADLADELACLEGDREVDRDGDGSGCMDCDDRDPAVHPGAFESCNRVDDDCSGLVDDSPVCTDPCPTALVGGVTFALCELPMSWHDAAAFCMAKGGTLARIDGAEQSQALYREAKRLDAKSRWWIGLHDRGAEGRFEWIDGTPVTFTGWAKGEPNNDTCNQDCAALKRRGDGTWHDTHCGQAQPFICRMP